MALRKYGVDITVAGLCGFGADLICQIGIDGASLDEIDARRLGAMTVFNAGYIGVCCGNVYATYPYWTRKAAKFLDVAAAKSVKNWPAGSKFETFISLLVDNIVHVPLIYVPTYFITVGAMQGETLSQSLGVLNSQWPAPAVTTSWAFWVPVMAMNFSIVPVAFRVQVVGVANFVWTVVLDYITHDAAAGGHGHARTAEQEGMARRASGEKERGGGDEGNERAIAR